MNWPFIIGVAILGAFALGCQHKLFTRDVLRRDVAPAERLCLSEHRVPSMGTFFELQLVHHCAFDPSQAVFQSQNLLDEIEKDLSLYQTESELSRLNRNGHLCSRSNHLLFLLKRSQEAFEETDGHFDVTILPVLRAIEHSFQKNKKPPRNLDHLRPLVGARGLRIQDNCIRFKKRGMAVSLDGIAKGYAVDKVALGLPSEIRSYLLNFSGNMRWRGQKPGGPWKVALWNPVRQEVTPLEVPEQGALASSGSEHLHFDPHQEWHHIIDPKTLRPARDFASVTVLGKTAMECDILSTSFSVLSLTKAQSLQQKRFRHIRLWLIDAAGEVKELF